METKLNITEILKDKPQGTKLHSPLFGKCTFLRIDDPLIEVLHHADNVSTFYSDGAYFTSDIKAFRPATDSEKQQLFSALAKVGKAWDANKKMIVDLKPKVELKPFDKVLVRDRVCDEWHIDLFECVLPEDSGYNYKGMANIWRFCIPYEGNEHLLDTTKDVEG